MKILVIGHGRFAEGVKSAAQIIVGDLSEVTFMNTYVDDIDFHVELDKYFSNNTNILVLDYYHPACRFPKLMKYYGLVGKYQKTLLRRGNML
mgnify:CR=1 FL=1